MDGARGGEVTSPRTEGQSVEPPQLIGLSGGKDSTGLAAYLCTNQPERNWHLAHVRHGLRDDAPDAKAAKATAAKLGRPFHEVPADWSAVKKAAGPEDGARQARYAAFITLANQLGATDVYLGHSADDQAETVLLRLVRGTGPSGVGGIQPTSNYGPLTIHRPLLAWPRETVRALADDYPTAEDPTNQDRTQRRAFIRHEVMPRLAQARPDGQSAVAAISSFAQLQREHNQLLDQLITSYVGPTWGPLHRVPNHEVNPGPLTRHLIHRALGSGASRDLVDAIASLDVGERRDLPNNHMAARDRFGWIIGPKTIAWAIELAIDTRSSSAQISTGCDPMVTCPLPWVIPIDANISIEDLAIRNRQPEDSRYKKLFSQFPKSLREQLPMVYAVSTGEVVSIGPLRLQPSDVHSARVRWITVIPRTIG